MTIDTSQNVGIGTTSPGQVLDVVKSQSSDTNVRVYNSSSNAAARSVYLLGNDTNATISGLIQNSSTNTAMGGANSLNVYMGFGAPISFLTSATERMRIDSSGNVGIGQSSPRNKLTVNGAISGLNASATASSNTTLFTTGTTAAYMIYATWNNGGGYAVIIAQGNISGTAVVIASSNAVGGNNAFDVQNNFASNSGNGIAIFPNSGALNLQIKQNYSGTANVFVNIFGM